MSIGTEPIVIEIQHVVVRSHFIPFFHAEDTVRIVPVLADPVQFDRVLPVFLQVLSWQRERMKYPGILMHEICKEVKPIRTVSGSVPF